MQKIDDCIYFQNQNSFQKNFCDTKFYHGLKEMKVLTCFTDIGGFSKGCWFEDFRSAFVKNHAVMKKKKQKEVLLFIFFLRSAKKNFAFNLIS